MRFEILNGAPKCTLIESFDGSASVLRSGKKHACKNLDEAKKLIERMGWEINIDHLFGSQVQRRII
jgi:hypothetical protein